MKNKSLAVLGIIAYLGSIVTDYLYIKDKSDLIGDLSVFFMLAGFLFLVLVIIWLKQRSIRQSIIFAIAVIAPSIIKAFKPVTMAPYDSLISLISFILSIISIVVVIWAIVILLKAKPTVSD